MNNTV